ncbi:MAG TPA: substrate-binding domain-containing protein [Vicinamibacteria bacterium]|nr:substrate-binding domain-containing protein [Vicinamibacteria bacterium]HRB13231.1 substrate-binding domain-containing protein [Vicinamibacteria bacterium]
MQPIRTRFLSSRSPWAPGLLLIGVCAAAGQKAPSPADQTLVRTEGPRDLLPLASALRNGWREQSEDMELSLGAGLSEKARLDALAGGAIDVAFAGHGLDLADVAARGMTAHRIGVTAVVLAVHADVTVLDLKPEDVCDIFSGRVMNWAAYGGADLSIRPVLRPDPEPDVEVLRAAIPCMARLTPGKTVTVARTASDMRAALQGTSGAIGVTTLAAVRQSIVALRSLSIASVAPSPANVLSGRYPLARPVWLVTLSPPPRSVGPFLAFVASDRGAAALAEAGALPIRPNQPYR